MKQRLAFVFGILALAAAAALVAPAYAGFSFPLWAKLPSRSNPNDPKSPFYISPVPTETPNNKSFNPTPTPQASPTTSGSSSEPGYYYIYTVAGSGTAGYSGNGGAAISAQMDYPSGVVSDSAGNLFVADTYNAMIREIVKSSGDIVTVAGTGSVGYSGDNGPATSAELNDPTGIALDGSGDIFIGDTGNQRVREVVKASGDIITAAGNGTKGYAGDNGVATSAEFDGPEGVALDSSGDIFIADLSNNLVRELVDSSGDIITAAGVFTTGGNGTGSYSGNNGPATSAHLDYDADVAVDSAGDFFISDGANEVVREVVKATGDIVTVAGTPGSAGYSGDNGPATSALLHIEGGGGLTVDGSGNIFIADSANNVVREVVKSSGYIFTVAGTGTPGNSGDSGPAEEAKLSGDQRLSVDSSGDIFVADSSNDVIRELMPETPPTATVSPTATITPTTTTTHWTDTATSTGTPTPTATETLVSLTNIYTVAGDGTPGYSGDNGLATSAELNRCHDVSVDGAGDIFIADTSNNRIREVVKTTGHIITYAGNGTGGYSGDNGPATSAELGNDGPTGGGFDSAGDFIFADQLNNRIREVNKTTEIITTIAGDGTQGYSGDNGSATSSELSAPNNILEDNSGNMYIGDQGNQRVREVVQASGDIITFAGNGTAGYSGDNGLATSAELHEPIEMAMDSQGNIYISDPLNYRVREVLKASGDIVTYAGNGTGGYSGDNGPATSAELDEPWGLAVDSAGDLFIADTFNQRIREVVKATGNIITVAGNGTQGYSGDNGPATSAEFNNPSGLFMDSGGNLYVADVGNSVIRKVGP